MSNKILVNGTIATKPWRTGVGKALLLIILIPSLLLFIPVGVIWFISLGHINLVGVWGRFFDCIDKGIFGETKGGLKKW